MMATLAIADIWVDFFLEAGIPSDEATSYALIFARNRIQRNMLVDLNKEYLKDMGITLLGDVIAILKHAQTVNENESKAIVMSQRYIPKVKKSTPKQNVPDNTHPAIKNYIEQFAEQYNEVEKSVANFPKLDAVTWRPGANLKEEPGLQPKSDVPTVLRPKKRKLDEDEAEFIKPNKQYDEVEESGAYLPNISDFEEKPVHQLKADKPSSTMPKQKKIKSYHTDTKVDKASIFARLGDSSVSSTTGEVLPVKKPPMSVFSRLGDLLAASSSHNSVAPDRNASSSLSMPKDKISSSKITSMSMRADQINVRKETPVMASNKKKTDFLKARDLEMLKITTEFSDDDDVIASDFNLPTEEIPDRSEPILFRDYREKDETRNEIIDSTECTSLILDSQPKRVRFGGTTTRILPAEPKKRKNPISFPNHSFLARKPHGARLINKKQPSSIGAVKPIKKANNFISKMVSDTFGAGRNKLSVKKRMQVKNKASILDRLG